MTPTLMTMLTNLALMDSLSKASAGSAAHFSKGGLRLLKQVTDVLRCHEEGQERQGG